MREIQEKEDPSLKVHFVAQKGQKVRSLRPLVDAEPVYHEVLCWVTMIKSAVS